MKRLLCITLPNWPIQRLHAAQPELKRRPLALYASYARAGQRIVACCIKAAAAGVRPGMPVADVDSALRPGERATAARLLLEKHDPAADRAGLERLAAWCEQFSPTVAIDTGAIDLPPVGHRGLNDRADSLVLDVTGLGPLFGGETALANLAVERLLSQRRLRAQVAIADTICGSWALAHWAAAPAGEPAPPVVVPPGKMLAALGPLPLAALRLADETAALLAQLGLSRIGQVLRLPRESLPSRFGAALLARLDQALGLAAQALTSYCPPRDYSAQWSLEYPTAQRHMLEAILRQLVQRVTDALAQQNRGVLQLDCEFICSAGAARLSVGLFEPSSQPIHLWEMICLQLERSRLPEAAQRVAVTAVRTAPIIPRQNALFVEHSRDDPIQRAWLIDRLSNRLGSGSVVQPRLRASAQPELAYRDVPLTGQALRAPNSRGRALRDRASRAARGALRPAMAAAEFGPLHRPLRLHSPPLPIEVIAVAPEGPPARFRERRTTEDVVRCWGPERIETSWWRGRLVRRDYYRVETPAGRRFWLFRRLDDGKWFLHGEF